MGNKIKVALLDSGVDINHEKLFNKEIMSIEFEENKDIIVNSLNDYSGHGTALAGLIYKHDPKIDLLGIKILNHELKSTTKTLIKGIEFAIEKKVDIINLSLGTVSSTNIKELKHVCDIANNNGIFIVAAHHNENIKSYPASFPNVFGVRSEFIPKNKGYRFEKNNMDIFTNGCYQKVLWKNNSYSYKRGNSYACGYFTGILADTLLQYPEARYCIEKLKDVLETNALKKISTSIKNIEEFQNKKIIYFPASYSFLKEFEEDIDYYNKIIVGIYDFRKFEVDHWNFTRNNNSYKLELYDNLEKALSNADAVYISNIDFIPNDNKSALLKNLLNTAIKLKKSIYMESQEVLDNLEEVLSLFKKNDLEFFIHHL